MFLGVRMWRAPALAGEAGPAVTGSRPSRMFLHAYLTTTLNPKTVLFFMVFVPQFIDLRTPSLPQFAALVPSVLVLGALSDGSYAMAAASLRRFVRAPRIARLVNRVCGGILVGEGVVAAAARGVMA